MIGKVCIGATVIGSPSGSVSIRVMHMSRGLPLISAVHEPHLPALQFQRQARSGAWSAWTRWMTSRTTSPSWAGQRVVGELRRRSASPRQMPHASPSPPGRPRLARRVGHQCASSNRPRSSSGITGSGSG